MTTSGPPFRAEHVGSLLRPDALKAARQAFAEGRLDADGLKQVEDREIVRAIRRQEEVGLRAVTDGEYRRSWWHLDFLEGLVGVEKYRTARSGEDVFRADIAVHQRQSGCESLC